MKANLVIDGSIYIMNCKIKPIGLGLFWHIKSNPSFEKLLRNNYIVFSTIESKYYTGDVAIYRNDSDADDIIISLEDKDFNTESKRHERVVLLTSLGLVLLLFCIMVLGSKLVTWLFA